MRSTLGRTDGGGRKGVSVRIPCFASAVALLRQSVFGSVLCSCEPRISPRFFSRDTMRSCVGEREFISGSPCSCTRTSACWLKPGGIIKSKNAAMVEKFCLASPSASSICARVTTGSLSMRASTRRVSATIASCGSAVTMPCTTCLPKGTCTREPIWIVEANSSGMV